MNKLTEYPKIGKKYRIYYNKNNVNNLTIHILAIVDKDQYVYKFWNKYKQRWEYDVKHEYYFKLLIRNNSLVKKY